MSPWMARQPKGRAAQAAVRSAPSRSAESPVQAERRAVNLDLILLAGTSLALYAISLLNGFVTDDTLQLQENTFLTSYHYIPKLFTTNVWSFLNASISNYYRPLQMLVYMGEYYAFGFHPRPWHLVNLLLNAAVVCAVFLLLRGLAGERLAFWAALWFAFHPIHVEVVVWIAALAELLCGLSLFTGTLFYHRASSGVRPLRNHALAAAIFFAGLFCKETAMIFPALLLAYEFFYRRESIRATFLGLRRLLPYLCLLGVYIAVRLKVLGSFAPGIASSAGHHARFTPWQTFLSVPALLCQYVFKLLLPVNLNYWYEFTTQNTLGWKVLASMALAVALVVLMFFLRKNQPLLAFSMAWFFITLSPVLSISNVGDNVFTERYLYIPSLGFCVLAAWAWLWVRDHASRKLLLAVAYPSLALVFIFYAVQIERRIPDWRTDLRLFQKTAEQSPYSAKVLSSLGVSYYQVGQVDSSIAPLERSLAIDPNAYLTHLYLALSLSLLGQNQDAGAHLARAYALMPPLHPPWSLFGQAYANLGQWDRAIECDRKALESEPDNPVLFSVLGEALLNEGETQAAMAAFRQAIQLEQGTLDASTNLAILLAKQGNTNEAIELLHSAVRVHGSEPKASLAYFNLGTVYLQKGDLDSAEAAYQRALELNPDLTSARQHLESLEARRHAHP
jgi:tetratricopeptide (TPR) repeat protein